MNEMERLLDIRGKQAEMGRGAMNAVRYEPPTLKQTLIERRDTLLAELTKVEGALRLFESEPKVTDAIETIMKALR